MYQLRVGEIDQAINGESARWGDSHTTSAESPGAGGAYTKAHWIATQNDLLANYFPLRTGVVQGQFNARGWSVPLGAPAMSQFGGEVAPGYALTLTKPGGAPAAATIYYTLDGSDPRDPATNLPRDSAMSYTGAIVINSGQRVQARIFNDATGASVNKWSPVSDATFLLDTPLPLRITELHYNPDDQDGVADAATMEFIEVTNVGGAPVSLDGVTIGGFAAEGYAFAAGQTLAAGERIIVARDPTIFSQVYGAGIRVATLGYANQNLSNGGEPLTLLGPFGEELQSFTYSDLVPWPEAADGDGKSLEIIDPLGDATNPANWRASYYRGGSPGMAGTAPAMAGDFDGDGVVTGNDFLAWQRGLGTPALVATAAAGDADGDRDVDAADLGLWSQNYGAAPPSAAAVVLASVVSDVQNGDSGPLLPDEWILQSDAASRRPAYRPRSAVAPDGEKMLASVVTAVYNRDGGSGADARRSTHGGEEGTRGGDEGSSQEFDAFDCAFEQLLDARLASALEGWHDRS
jgi:hypothetical protein